MPSIYRRIICDKRPLTPPDAHNAYLVRIASIDDSKRRVYQFPQKFLTKLRNHTPHVGMIAQPIYPLQDLFDKPIPHLRHCLSGIPAFYGFEV